MNQNVYVFNVNMRMEVYEVCEFQAIQNAWSIIRPSYSQKISKYMGIVICCQCPGEDRCTELKKKL